MHRDYKFLSRPERSWWATLLRPGKAHLAVLLVIVSLSGFLLSATPDDAAATRSASVVPGDGTVVQTVALPRNEQVAMNIPAATADSSDRAPLPPLPPVATEEPPAEDPLATGDGSETLEEMVESAVEAEVEEESGVWHEAGVDSGDSLARIFRRLDLSAAELHQIMQASGPVDRLKRLHPGEHLRLRADEEGRVQEVILEIDRTNSIRVQREGDGFVAEEIARPFEVRVTHATGVIEHSLFVAGQDAGLSDALTMELATLFGWDIDLALDLRRGDRFAVIYHERFLDGEKIGDGAIVAAEFENQGKTYRAIRFTDADGRTGYYTPEGLSVRKAFLRTPVKFSRISSRFNLKRKHPVLNRIRAHRGVDYAAPPGTPIRATGDGKVIFRGTKGGYGHTVIIRHGSSYSTLYAHMSRFNNKVRLGRTVHQGQVIGYVGSSGLATGPHLHYEFRVNGVHRNPLTVDLPVATPIATLELPAFRSAADPLVAQLDVLARTQVARSEP